MFANVATLDLLSLLYNKAAIFKITFSNVFSWMKCIKFAIEFTEVCSRDPINDIPALDQIMGCRRPGDKPLS